MSSPPVTEVEIAPTVEAVPTVEITPAHEQVLTVHIVERIPHHPTRESDPYYHLFNEARARMKRLGLLKCWVCGTAENIEVHHTEVEFSMANGVDLDRFAELHPDFAITGDASFQAFVEGPHNLTALCRMHHTGVFGIHSIPYPNWQCFRWWKHDLAAPAEVVKVSVPASATVTVTSTDPDVPDIAVTVS